MRHAQKVLIKFRLLEWQSIHRQALFRWVKETPYLSQAMPSESPADEAWLNALLGELERSQALRMEGDLVINI